MYSVLSVFRYFLTENSWTIRGMCVTVLTFSLDLFIESQLRFEFKDGCMKIKKKCKYVESDMYPTTRKY